MRSMRIRNPHPRRPRLPPMRREVEVPLGPKKQTHEVTGGAEDCHLNYLNSLLAENSTTYQNLLSSITYAALSRAISNIGISAADSSGRYLVIVAYAGCLPWITKMKLLCIGKSSLLLLLTLGLTLKDSKTTWRRWRSWRLMNGSEDMESAGRPRLSIMKQSTTSGAFTRLSRW